ncbi:orotidine-5'-phosphate decarboxylase [Aquiluna borgnonia]|uniref:Orotidine-5'-phosphate decarboxylase n=1 Tax=Aquiluna borgnonia TaxID=2499157 RepID=A0A7D4UJY9_9MICO|nr:orotidine-5'-phosphate decarboxylase [Aquiluna borgnonia]QKJ25279.1 orotidine-5'-phosphate decarboxylase [Aquiluna borgnonia]
MGKFSARLSRSVAEFGPICLGIDPSETELGNFDLPDSAAGAREYGLRLVNAATGLIGIVKPQIGFFERFGSLGYQALEEVITAARDASLLVIADAKRGDIGTTMLGYAQGWFGDDSPLRSDALTVSGYLGPSSLAETLDHALDVQAGLFLLAATSNPEAGELQKGMIGSQTVASRAIELASEIGRGEIGVVIGATQDLEEFGIGRVKESDIGIPILAPGFGAQGALLENLESIFGASSGRVIAAMSRELTRGGAAKLVRNIEKAKEKL